MSNNKLIIIGGGGDLIKWPTEVFYTFPCFFLCLSKRYLNLWI